MSLTLFWVTLGVVAAIGVAIGIYYAVTRRHKKKTKKSEEETFLQQAPTPSPAAATITLTPRDTNPRVEYWSDAWRFKQPDVGVISFDVVKESGLIVTIGNLAGYPKEGYSIIVDKRGGHETSYADTKTSMTYIARLPMMDGPAHNSAAVRNVELANIRRHIVITYDHGYIEVFVDGLKVIAYNDPIPSAGMSYVGFGDLGLKSGVGTIDNLVIT